ncbi:hypothetical protein ACIBG0_38825 [Nocardia sp. NPDC050630]|uniref:hypothetical protein n=1 Tax=Nocardia sp. NPDC050630 TaxID=3364321 RepID=UPI003796B73C
MVWFNVDDTLAFHPKAIKAGNAALGLWVRAGSWSAQTLSDGFVPRQIARSLGSIGQCKALVTAGLWVEVDGGYQFHQWDQKQQTKSDVELRRESERKRKADQRKSKKVPPGQPQGQPEDVQPESPGDSHRDSRVESQTESQQVSGSPIPSYPFPSLSSGYVGGESLVANARENEPPDPYCPRHPGGTSEPCGQCAERRKAWVAANLARDQRAAAEAAERAELERLAKHQAAEDRARAIDDCPLGCAERDGYRPNGQVCDHDPDAAERARRGSAAVREALAAAKAARAAEPHQHNGTEDHHVA